MTRRQSVSLYVRAASFALASSSLRFATRGGFARGRQPLARAGIKAAIGLARLANLLAPVLGRAA